MQEVNEAIREHEYEFMASDDPITTYTTKQFHDKHTEIVLSIRHRHMKALERSAMEMQEQVRLAIEDGRMTQEDHDDAVLAYEEELEQRRKQWRLDRAEKEHERQEWLADPKSDPMRPPGRKTEEPAALLAPKT
eukprot:TRINITY_DN2407_c0_g1_i3.p2 TRINITY_DN2407_c0_g1~~TRINITY_DN2407_c0_g1_i3.p2  ORF type:complete len:134 (+),score=41.15 TRINITY_DN2407_c0_g1_i3:590-991(+)